MPIKSSSTAILGLTMTILLAAPAEAHTANYHHHHHHFATFSDCSVLVGPLNNGHDRRVFVLSCPLDRNRGGGHDRDNGHDRGGGHDRDNGSKVK